MGKDWKDKLNFLLNMVTFKLLTITSLNNGVYEVIDDSLRKYNKAKIKLELKNKVTPKFFKPLQIPSAMKSKIDTEINHLIVNVVR